jgi:hypothetical protein
MKKNRHILVENAYNGDDVILIAFSHGEKYENDY